MIFVGMYFKRSTAIDGVPESGVIAHVSRGTKFFQAYIRFHVLRENIIGLSLKN